MKTFHIVFSTLLLLPSAANAATDGTLGATSTGSSDISVTIPTRVQITNVNDLAFGSWNGTGSLALSDNVCIYSSDVSGIYSVTLSGNGTGGAFTLAGSGGGTLSYTVKWNDQTGTTGSTSVTSGNILTGQSGACDKSSTCNGCGGTNANFEVTLADTALGTAIAGSYTGTLSIMIEPQ